MPASQRMAFGLDLTPAALERPQALDWRGARISSGTIQRSRQAYLAGYRQQGRDLLAFPAPAGGWGTAGAAPGPGVNLTAFGCGATDTMPNGPACSFFGATVPAVLTNKVFLITKAGRFIKASRSAPTTSFSAINVGGGTYSDTYVSLSPSCTRAYLLSDGGTFTVVDTLNMTVLATQAVGGGYGIAPVLDPVTTSTDDQWDQVYVAGNDGLVKGWYVTLTSQTTRAVSLTPIGTFDVASSVTPVAAGNTRKVQAPPLVYNKQIFLNDNEGNLDVYDTVNPANSTSYDISDYEIHSAPSIELQDGSYALTDPYGAPTTVPNGAAVFVFATIGSDEGPECVWVDLVAQTADYSLPLYMDDNDNGRKFGYVQDYHYAATKTKVYLPAQDGVNLNTDTAAPAANQNLPGTSPAANRSSAYVQPAETDVYAASGAARGGPVYTYLRFKDPNVNSYDVGTTISSAELRLTTPNQNRSCKVPEVWGTSPYNNGLAANGYWTSAALTNATRPPFGNRAGKFKTGGVNGQGIKHFGANQQVRWGATAGLPNAPTSDYALALKYNAGNTVYYPGGPVAANTVGNLAPFSAVQFLNNAANANPAAGSAKDTRPLLLLNLVTAKNLPLVPMETAPVVDSWAKKIYVVNTNEVFQLDFSSLTAFTDTDYDPVTKFGTKYTLFNDLYWGNKKGSTWNGKANFVNNETQPALAYDSSAIFCYSYYPVQTGTATPTDWDVAISQITLPLVSNADNMVVTNSGTTAGANTLTDNNTNTGNLKSYACSNILLLDPNVAGWSTGGGPYFGLVGNNRVYQFDP